jgi:two-component system C4-dicarboxylate transport response regulator DctD
MGITPPFRILLVDDEPDTLFVLSRSLEKHGYKVDAFANPTEVLSIFKPCLYHLALLDIRMAEMEGFQLYEHIAALDPDIKVCFLTAYDLATISSFRINHKRKVPDDCYLTKPINLPKLLGIIKTQLESRAPADDKESM